MHIFRLFNFILNKNSSGLIVLPPLSHTCPPTTEAFLIPWYEFLCSLLTEVRVLSDQPLRRQLFESRNRHLKFEAAKRFLRCWTQMTVARRRSPWYYHNFCAFSKTLYACNLIFCPTFILLTLNCHPPRRYIWKTSVNIYWNQNRHIIVSLKGRNTNPI